MPDRELPHKPDHRTKPRPPAFLSAVERRVSHTAICASYRHRFEGEFIVSTTNGGTGRSHRADSAPQLMVLRSTSRISRSRIRTRRLAAAATQPQISISVNVTANPCPDTDFEVKLKLEGKAEANGTVLFSFELDVRRRVPDSERAAGHVAARW